MTIAAGFVSSDGILLASDTLYSGGYANEYGPKYWVLGDGNAVIFGGSGTRRGLLRTRDEIQRFLRPGMSRPEIVNVVDTALLEVNKKLQPKDWSEYTSALVVIRAEGSQWLYENDGGGSMISLVEGQGQCTGAGAPLGMYFLRSLFRDGMPLRWAKVVAAQVIKQCKAHASGCDGDTHLVEVPKDGDPRLIHDQAEIAPLEGHLDVMQAVTRAILLDDRASDDTLFERAKILNETVRALEKKFFVNIPPASLTISAPSMQANVIVGKLPEGKPDPE